MEVGEKRPPGGREKNRRRSAEKEKNTHKTTNGREFRLGERNGTGGGGGGAHRGRGTRPNSGRGKRAAKVNERLTKQKTDLGGGLRGFYHYGAHARKR